MEEGATIPVHAAEVSQISDWPELEFCCWHIPWNTTVFEPRRRMERLQGLRIVLSSNLRDDRFLNVREMPVLDELIIEGPSSRSRPPLYSFHVHGSSQSVTKLALANLHLQNDYTGLLRKFPAVKRLSFWQVSHNCSMADWPPVNLDNLTHWNVLWQECNEVPCRFLSSVGHPISTQQNLYKENSSDQEPLHEGQQCFSRFSTLLRLPSDWQGRRQSTTPPITRRTTARPVSRVATRASQADSKNSAKQSQVPNPTPSGRNLRSSIPAPRASRLRGPRARRQSSRYLG